MKINRIILSGIISSMLLISCDYKPAAKEAVRPRFKGTTEEQMAYHRREMRRYKDAAVKEEKKAIKFLGQNHLRATRECYSRKKHCLSKAEHHHRILKSLDGEQRS